MSRIYSFISFVVAMSLAQAFGQDDPSASLFGLDNVIDVHITIKPDEWSKLQPPAHVRLDGEAVGEADKMRVDSEAE